MAVVWSWCGLLLLETICFKVMVIRVTVTPLSMKQSDHSPMTSEINKALCRSLDIFCLSVLEKPQEGRKIPEHHQFLKYWHHPETAAT